MFARFTGLFSKKSESEERNKFSREARFSASGRPVDEASASEKSEHYAQEHDALECSSLLRTASQSPHHSPRSSKK